MNRHDLVYLDENKLDFDICSFSKEEDERIIFNWIKNRNPIMITRQQFEDKEKINVGFMLPLEKNKKRVNFIINSESIKNIESDIKLSEILPILENRWQKPLLELIESFLTLGLDIFIFGSALWQYLTNEKYMRYESDIDLLWKPKKLEDLEKGLLILKKWMKNYSLKIDGEVILPCQNACSWKELLNDDKNILVKNLHNVYLESKENFVNSLRIN